MKPSGRPRSPTPPPIRPSHSRSSLDGCSGVGASASSIRRPAYDGPVMAKINGNEIRPGMVIEHDGSLWAAVKTMAVKPGKGPAYNQVELKNLIDGRKLNQRFGSAATGSRRPRSSAGVPVPLRAGRAAGVHGHRQATSRSSCSEDFVGERAAFLQDGMMVQVATARASGRSASSCRTVVLEVVEADAVVKGQTAARPTSRRSSRTACACWCRRSSPPARRSWSRPTKSPTCARAD